jgi:hypothetical protein
MKHARSRSAFTFVELLALIAILGLLVVVGCGRAAAERESARRAACTSNIRQLGSALLGFHDCNRQFPAAGEYQPTGTPQWGYSWLVLVLPFIDNVVLYDQMKIKKMPDPSTNTVALQTRVSAFACPSYSGPEWVTPAKGGSPAQGGISNYKTMGATHQASLVCTTSTNPTPPYGQAGDHPDGALFPGRNLRISDFGDGLSNTIMLCETIEETYAQWHVGQYATLVGLPPGYNYEKAGATPNLDFYAPAGFTRGKYGEETTVTDAKKLGTYLSWDYNASPYDPSLPMKYGPSSNHNNVVNHLFGNNAVRSISVNVDPALYMFVITRSGGDPADLFFGPPVR